VICLIRVHDAEDEECESSKKRDWLSVTGSTISPDSDLLCLIESLVERNRPPMTAINVQRLCPTMVPNAITGTDCDVSYRSLHRVADVWLPFIQDQVTHLG
jgi:hypothetical protein